MATTNVLPSSPGPWSATANLSFDDLIDFPSPAPTPRMSNATVPAQPQRTAAPAPAPVAAASAATNASAPPPGSTPEVLFRYYLAAELRRIGSSADESIIDKYVAQHYASLSKVKTTAAPAAPSVPSTSALPAAAPAYAAYRPPSPVHFSPAQAFKVTPEPSAHSAPVSIDPHLVELQQSGVVPNATLNPSFTTARAAPYPQASTPAVKAVPRSTSADAMSEDEASEHSDGSEDEDEEDSKETVRGGPKQRSVSSSASANDAGHHRHTGISAAAMLRPSPEEYKKLSSKEKRQLRNKISARNFRTRRKEHITQLEEQLADRDAIIDGLRAQLANVNLQNEALKDEVKTLKTKTLSQADVQRILEALQRSTAGSALNFPLAPTAPMEPTLNRTSSSSSLNFLNGDVNMASGSRPSTPSSPRPSIVRRSTPTLATPNTRKDVGSGSSFWGGANGGANALISAA